MRPIERYVRSMVEDYPQPPRPCNWWLLLSLCAPSKSVAVLLAVLVWISLHMRYTPFSLTAYTSEYTFVLVCLGAFIISDIYRCLSMLYHYGYGIRTGDYTTASVRTITRYVSGQASQSQGLCLIERPHEHLRRIFTLDHQRCGAWSERVTIGDTLHLLLHPITAQILVVFGKHPTLATPSIPRADQDDADTPLVEHEPQQQRHTHPGYHSILLIIVVTSLFGSGPLVVKMLHGEAHLENALIIFGLVLGSNLGLYRGHERIRQFASAGYGFVALYGMSVGLNLLSQQPGMGGIFIGGSVLIGACALALRHVTVVLDYFTHPPPKKP